MKMNGFLNTVLGLTAVAASVQNVVAQTVDGNRKTGNEKTIDCSMDGKVDAFKIAFGRVGDMNGDGTTASLLNIREPFNKRGYLNEAHVRLNVTPFTGYGDQVKYVRQFEGQKEVFTKTADTKSGTFEDVHLDATAMAAYKAFVVDAQEQCQANGAKRTQELDQNKGAVTSSRIVVGLTDQEIAGAKAIRASFLNK